MLAWALYDWANSAFATTVMAGFFPTFFRQYWSLGADPTDSTCAPRAAPMASPASWSRCWRRSSARSPTAAAGASAACSPGPRSACSAPRGCISSARGDWLLAALLFCLGTMGFNGGIVFYDSLLPMVARTSDYDRVSALGYALGYLGGGLLFAVNVVMVLRPGWFGLGSPAAAVQCAFLTVAIWWAVFSVPLMWGVRETAAPGTSAGRADRAAPASALAHGWRELGRTVARGAPAARAVVVPASLTGSTSTASTRSSRWPSTSAWP